MAPNAEGATRVTPSLRTSAAACLLLAAACAHGRSERGAPGFTNFDAPDTVYVEVINDHYYDARVHVLYDGGARYAVGTIGGNQRQDAVAIPWRPRALVVEVTMIIQGSVYRSQAVDAARGDVVEVRLPPNIETSGFFTRISP